MRGSPIDVRRSKQTWHAYWFERGLQPNSPSEVVKRTSCPEALENGWQWIHSRQIWLLRGSQTTKYRKYIPAIAENLTAFLAEIGLNITVVDAGIDRKFNRAVNRQLEDGQICPPYLVEQAAIGRKHAILYLTDYPLIHTYNPFSSQVAGYGNFYTGVMIVPLFIEEQLAHIFKTVRHETVHLLGLNREDEHSTHFDVPDYELAFPRDCVFSSLSERSAQVCPTHLDAILYFWRGLEEKTGKLFLL